MIPTSVQRQTPRLSILFVCFSLQVAPHWQTEERKRLIKEARRRKLASLLGTRPLGFLSPSKMSPIDDPVCPNTCCRDVQCSPFERVTTTPKKRNVVAILKVSKTLMG